MKSEADKLTELRKKLNKSIFGRNIAVMFCGILFIVWIFDLSPCIVGNVYLFGFVFVYLLVLSIHQLIIHFKLKSYERNKKE